MSDVVSKQIPIWEKYLLTIKEASEYFNIGENKMYKIANEYIDSEYKFVVQNGSRTMINRYLFDIHRFLKAFLSYLFFFHSFQSAPFHQKKP